MAVRPLYAVGMAHACASGELERMRELARQAEEHLREYGDVSAALEVLRVEIARLEQKQSGGS